MPEFVDDDLEGELRPVWGEGIGAAGFAALHNIEVRRRYGEQSGVVLPTGRLQEVVDFPDRSELTELCEAFRLLQEAVDRVLSSSEASVTHGDGSVCDRWARDIERLRIEDGADDAPPLTAQQRSRVDHSVQTYRDCYGDGKRVTDFGVVESARPSESEQLRLFGFGIFDHGEEIRVPVAPDSGRPLPVYPQSTNELDRARELLDEFPARPGAGAPR
jgi:hypothetical protein